MKLLKILFINNELKMETCRGVPVMQANIQCHAMMISLMGKFQGKDMRRANNHTGKFHTGIDIRVFSTACSIVAATR